MIVENRVAVHVIERAEIRQDSTLYDKMLEPFADVLIVKLYP